MKKVFDYAFQFCEGAIKYISILPFALLLICSTLYQNTISFDVMEKSTIVPNGPSFFIVLILSVPTLYVIYKLLKFVPENALFIVFAAIYLLAGIFCITHIQMTPRHDSAICYWSAVNYKAGSFINLQPGEYFYEYPHQLGLVTYNRLLVELSENVNLVYYTNLLWIILTNFFLWRISCLLYKENPLLRKLVVLLTFCFLPQFFYLFFAYGQVPGTLCMTASLFFCIKYLKKNCHWYLILGCLFLALSCLLRKNFLIGGVALIIVFLLKALRDKKICYLLAIIALVACIIIPSKLVVGHYEKVGGIELNNGSPALLHIAMGLQENDELWRAAGWFNGYNEQTYDLYNYDAEICSEIALESIKDSLFTFKCYPEYAFDFFSEKIITTWCEPTFQSVWSGPMISLEHVTNSSILGNIYSGGSVFWIMSSLMNILLVMIFLFSLTLTIIKTFVAKENLTSAELFSILFFIGGFLFHLVWETKSQYVYPYVVMLIPFACNGMVQVFAYVDELINKRKK